MVHYNSRRYTNETKDRLSRFFNHTYQPNPSEMWFYNVQPLGSARFFINVGRKQLEILTEDEREQVLDELSTNPRTFGSTQQIYEQVKDLYCGISRRDIDAYLQKKEYYQLRKKPMGSRITKPIITSRVNQRWQIDLFFLDRYSRFNRGYGIVLSCIDLFSKFLWCIPLKTKSAEGIKLGMMKIFQTSSKKPEVIQSDNSKEFHSKELNDYFRMLSIKHQYSSTYNPSSQGQVEQVNGTVKNLIKSFIVINDDIRFFRWVDALDSLVFNYNNRVHSRTGFRPQYIQFGHPSEMDIEKVKMRIYENGISKLRNVSPKKMLKVGDKVRIALRALDKYRKNVDLLKQTALRWTREIYTVKGIYKGKEDPEIVLPMYVIGNERGVLRNRFKFFDLQKVE